MISTPPPSPSPQSRNGSRWPEIAIIGAYPPPYGGISVHLQRLLQRLDTRGDDYILYNARSSSERPPHVKSISKNKYWWYLGFCLRHRCRIVHLLSENWPSRVLFGLAACIRPGKYVLSLQGQITPDMLKKGGIIRSWLTRWLLHRMDAVIACHPDIARDCVEGAGLSPEKVYMVPAFIPPDPTHAPPLPGYIEEFIAAHGPVVSAVGWLGVDYEGADLYGIDMMVDLIERLRDSYPDIGLVYSFNSDFPDKIDATVRDIRRRVGDRILLVSEPLEDISRLMSSSDLFVRPTNTDGDAVSIREALHLDVPVVASDAVPRPDGCLVFRSRDMDDFETKIRDALNRLDQLKQRVAACVMPDNAEPILLMYDALRRAS